jgi:hypothetical protein
MAVILIGGYAQRTQSPHGEPSIIHLFVCASPSLPSDLAFLKRIRDCAMGQTTEGVQSLLDPQYQFDTSHGARDPEMTGQNECDDTVADRSPITGQVNVFICVY